MTTTPPPPEQPKQAEPPLLPCPFCGESELVFYITDEHDCHAAICNRCGAKIEYDNNSGSVIERWNRRAPEPPAAAEQSRSELWLRGFEAGQAASAPAPSATGMLRSQQEWFEFCIEKGTSGDQVFDILKDWQKEMDRIKQAASTPSSGGISSRAIPLGEPHSKYLVVPLEDAEALEATVGRLRGELDATTTHLRIIREAQKEAFDKVESLIVEVERLKAEKEAVEQRVWELELEIADMEKRDGQK